MAGLLSLASLLGWFVAVLWLARQLTSKVKSRALQNALMIPTVIALVALPVTDEIIGGFQFRALCRDNAVLKIDAKKIKGKTVHMVSDPENKDIENTTVRIYYTRVSYRDVTTQEELASNGYLVAMGGQLIRAFGGGHELKPMTIFPSTCSGPGNLPTSKKYEFNIDTQSEGITK